MKCCFGYTTLFPLMEKRIKYYDENGIHDEAVHDNEMISLGKKLRDDGYIYAEDLGKAETRMFETDPNDPKYEKVLARLNRVRDKYGIVHWNEKERVA